MPDITERGDAESPLMEEQEIPIPAAKLAWLTDAADLLVLLASFLLTAMSIVLVALIFQAQAVNSYYSFPKSRITSILQRIISSLSVTVTSAVIMVAGKRYVLFKLARGGLRSRRVAVYSNSTIGNLVSYLVLRGAELPLLGLSIVWGLALATGLTVNSSWEMGSISSWQQIAVPFGPLDLPAPGSSWVVPALEQLTFVMSSWCLGLPDAVGLINIIGANITSDSSNPMGTTYYPPLSFLGASADYSFSTTTTMNGFNISSEQLSSVPSSAQNLSSCTPSTIPAVQLWSDGADNRTLSIILAVNDSDSTTILRVNATAIIMGGTLSSYGNYTEFSQNGTSWSNVMSTGDRWAQDIINIVCNATLPQSMAVCSPGSSLSDFISVVEVELGLITGNDYGSHWGSVLNTALGAYSAAMLSPSVALDGTFILHAPETPVEITDYDFQITTTYATYILLANIIVSIVMVIIVVKLRMASHLGSDFLHSTRLLLDPLKKPELFNASLQTTVDALADPYMVVKTDSMYLLSEETAAEKESGWFDMLPLRKRKQPSETWDDSATEETLR